jgi:hypothetical protein
MPSYTKRIASAAHQAPPHRPTETLLHSPWDCQSSGLALLPARAVPPQTPIPQTHTISLRQVIKDEDPQTFVISTRPCPQTCTGLHDLCSASHIPKAYMPEIHTCMISVLLNRALQACTRPHDHH